MRYQFHPEALNEFQESASFYEAQQRDLGLRFIAAVQATVDRIVATPESWRIMDGDVRRLLTKVFPYAVLYSIEKDYVLIVAVMHCHREPGYWRHRI